MPKRICYTVIIFISYLSIYSCTSATNSNSLFQKVSASASGIHFSNEIEENDSINPIDLEFLYNGGGVGVGDFNNDSLPDIYFTASTVSNKLYLNKGGLSFEDVTERAKVTGQGRWCNAVSVIDINNDGLMDIYLCTTIKKNPRERKNILYINRGLDANKIPVFEDMATEYGLADTSYSVQAAFLDYDADGDLDMYLAATKLAGRNAAQFYNKNIADSSNEDFDKLYRNDWNAQLQHPVFTDVTKRSGIGAHGFALGLAVTDINQDGWPDIYVANDFFTSDELYVNNRDGTFSSQLDAYFKHTAQNAMGTDIADINNDGLADIVTVDMNPEGNFRKKKNMSSANYYVYQNMINGNYALQYIRNTLQLNQGGRLLENDSIGPPIFGDIGFLAGVAETDWSWNPSLADFDNDGYRDLVITNGYPRDVTDHDFAAFRQKASPQISKKALIDEMPSIKIHNYAFRNQGNLHFENVTAQWGMNEPSFSSGAAYVDLDNDGDLDYVVNNINENAFLYENTLNTPQKITGNYIQLSFKGPAQNINGINARVSIYYNGKMQVMENNPVRGYLSSVQNTLHFGLGNVGQIDSIVVRWDLHQKSVLRNVRANQRLTIDTKQSEAGALLPPTADALFADITEGSGIHYRHTEVDFVDFNHQRLLPHKFSQYAPGLAAGDVNGDGLDDIVTGGNSVSDALVFLQQPNGSFSQQPLPRDTGSNARSPESLGILLFDADSDGDIDIYMSSGSTEFMPATPNYQDRLYVNVGGGKFRIDKKALPANYTSKSCVKASDYDHDGDLDLFVGGRVLPGKYPQPVSSILLRNDSKTGIIRFTDVTTTLAKDLVDIGLVCDAVWTDFDNDGWEDLVLAGEWMPLVFIKNEKGTLKNATNETGIAGFKGWWNSITPGDFDNDGDVDYVAGNLGLNSFYRASGRYPLRIYGNDFDKNGGYDIITSIYFKDQKGEAREFPAQNRDEIVEQIPALKNKFLTYKSFGNATVTDIFSGNDMRGALVLEANQMQSCYIKNNGRGRFEIIPLPVAAQLAPIYGMVVEDFNADGYLDVVISGNDFGTEVSSGRYDAMNGLLLAGNGKGNFHAMPVMQSGIFIPGDGKALVGLRQAGGHYLLAASQNRDVLKVFRMKKEMELAMALRNENNALIYLKDGAVRKQEITYGSSFLSQSLNVVMMTEAVDSVIFRDRLGNRRKMINKQRQRSIHGSKLSKSP